MKIATVFIKNLFNFRDEIDEVLEIKDQIIIDKRTRQPAIGLIRAQVLPPSDGGLNCQYPYLMWKSANNEVKKGLCHYCSNNERIKGLLDEGSVRNYCCKCPDSDRSFILTTTIEELSYAMKERGVTIEIIFEAYLFMSKEPIFKQFIQGLYNFMEDDKIEISKPMRKKFVKPIICCAFGKLGQRNTILKKTKCWTNQELVDLVNSAKRNNKSIVDMDFTNDCFVEVTMETNQQNKDLKKNVIISSYVTAYTRQKFDIHIMKMLSKDIFFKLSNLFNIHLFRRIS